MFRQVSPFNTLSKFIKKILEKENARKRAKSRVRPDERNEQREHTTTWVSYCRMLNQRAILQQFSHVKNTQHFFTEIKTSLKTVYF